MPKPRNAIGLNRNVPAEDTEKLLLANVNINDDTQR